MPDDLMDVRMPDGYLIKGVPKGTSKRDIATKYVAWSAKNAPQPKPPQVEMKESTAPKAFRAATSALPGVGGLAGGAVGMGASPLGAVAGGALGGAGGAQLERIINNAVMKDPIGTGKQQAASMGMGALEGATSGMGVGKAMGDAAAMAPGVLEKTGKVGYEAVPQGVKDKAAKEAINNLAKKSPQFQKTTLGKQISSWASNRDPLTGKMVGQDHAASELQALLQKKPVQTMLKQWGERAFTDSPDEQALYSRALESAAPAEKAAGAAGKDEAAKAAGKHVMNKMVRHGATLAAGMAGGAVSESTIGTHIPGWVAGYELMKHFYPW